MSIDPTDKQLTLNPALNQWIKEAAELTRPERIVVCDGSEAERERLTREAVAAGVLIRLNPEKRPGCYLHRSNPNDVARTEDVTFICTPSREDAGATNNWMAPDGGLRQARRDASTARCAGGRCMSIPYVMGPVGSPFAKVGIEITDSIYVVAQHGDHDAHGPRCAGRCWASRTDFNRGLHCTLDLDPSGASSVISRKTTRSGRSAAATAATRC